MKQGADTILHREQEEYLAGLIPPRDEVFASLEADAAQHDVPIVDPELGRFLQVAALTAGARRILEVGTATGYSGLHFLRVLPADGELVTIDVSEERQRIARDHWRRAGVSERATTLLGPAIELLPGIEGPFDIVFLDAIKSEYGRYLDLALPKLRPGGLLIADNVLWGGRIARGEHDADADALRAFNAYAMAHPELHAIILPLGDGVLYAAKRDTPAGG
jgi:caffeoyl-CoA O-methyltransferase